VSPALVEPSPGGSQAGTGPAVSSADPVSGVPPSHVSAQQAVPRDAVSTVPVGTRLGRLAPRCLPAGVCWNTTQLLPISWVLLPPRLIGSHLTTASIPDCRPGHVLRLSLEVTSFLGAGQPLRIGIGPETHGYLGSPSLGLLPCGLLCPYQRTPLLGIMVSTPRGLRAHHSPSLSHLGLSHLPRSPTQPSTPCTI
jgi:hypothetical protein